MADLNIKTVKVTACRIEVSPAEIIEIVKEWARRGWPENVEPILTNITIHEVPSMVFEGAKSEEVPND